MSFFNGIDADERGMLHDLIGVLVEKLNTQRRLSEDLARKLDAAEARLLVLEAVNYGAF